VPDATPHADPRVHGPAICPRAPKGCEACSGQHHWLEAFCDSPEDDFDPEDNARERAVRLWDKQHGTDHSGTGHYGCKHCDTWAESDFVEELIEADDEGDEGFECWCGASGPIGEMLDDSGLELNCGGTGSLNCECGGDFCVCHYHGSTECPGCEDCEQDDDGFDEDYQGEDDG
jgi:hypothetical protein